MYSERIYIRYIPALSFLILFCLNFAHSTGPTKNTQAAQPVQNGDRPNILLLVADDLGYADPGCYGGDIETPNIDSLAASGLRFSRFHTSPLCAPTRSMLLSGNDNHIAGMGVQSLVTAEFGYEGKLSDRIVTIPQVLSESGYHTYMAGKWHLGMNQADDPHQKGFEHSFVLLHGAGNHYNDQGLFKQYPVSLYREDGRPAKWEEGRYSTDFYTDKLIEYIEQHRGDGRPFFAFAAYTSPHWPLQVDEKFSKKYRGRYEDGYEALRIKRLASLKQAGMVHIAATLPSLNPRVKPWNSLSEAEKRKEARKMELYAGMVDNLDHNIGRLIQYLKRIGEFERTVVLFMSDNGAAAEDFYYNDTYGPFIREHFNDDYENMGRPNSFISYGPQWAEAGSAPFKNFKGHVTEGGLTAPMILSGPGINRKNEIYHDLVTVMDIAPSFYQLAGVKYPEKYGSRDVYPLKGKSVIDMAAGRSESVHDKDYVFGLEHNGRAMLRKGQWKIVNEQRPFTPEGFMLYDLSQDPEENEDLKEKVPEKYRELLEEWTKFSREIKVRFPAPKGSE